MEARQWKKSAKGVESTPSSSSSSCSITNLPNPVLMEILCRVSIKTLTTSKTVCKSWFNLIKDPHFIQLHQRRSPTEVCLQYYHDEEDNTLKLHLGNFHFSSNLDPCHFEIPKFSVKSGNVLNYKVVSRKFIFANSCNGLLCYYGYRNYRFAVVWNPCTGEFITFPPPSGPCRGYGFGFSRKENKFKLLQLNGERGINPSNDTVLAYICTIEKGCSWKCIGLCSSHAWFRDYPDTGRDLHAVFLNGTLHWVGTDDNMSHIAIHTFDFEDDHFGELPLPPCFDEIYSENVLSEEKLGVLGGCLFVSDYTDGGMTIWLMREYGVQASWTKLFSLGSTIGKGLKLKYSRCIPITYMDSGEILMKFISNFPAVIIYNPVQRSARLVGMCPASLRVIPYRPSLVLLKDSMLGYHVNVKPMRSDLKQGEIPVNPDWWAPMGNQWVPMGKPALQHGSKAPLTDDELTSAGVEEEGEGNVSGKGLMQISTTSAGDLARQQGPETPVTTDEIHVSATGEDRLEQITTLVREVLEELRKEREQQQELEGRLRNELEPLKEQAEHLKQQNQLLEE